MRVFGLFVILLLYGWGGYAQTRVDSIRSKLFDRSDKTVLVVAHRGDWRNACENSIEAIIGAIKAGADIVEIDLRKTKDGELILMHDDTLDRTTTGTGKVGEHTWVELKGLYLRNGCHIKTIYRIPTLREALLATKGRVMLNLDKAFDYFDLVYNLLKETGTIDQVIIKSNTSAQDVQKKYGSFLDEVIFMPKVNLDDKNALDKLNDYLSLLNPVAVEFKFAHDSNKVPFAVKSILSNRCRIWYNTLWDTHAGGHDDDCSLVDPEKGYGYLIDSLGATILQTDRPAYLKEYLRKKGSNSDMAL